LPAPDKPVIQNTRPGAIIENTYSTAAPRRLHCRLLSLSCHIKQHLIRIDKQPGREACDTGQIFGLPMRLFSAIG
jgi:hypothetical protein